MTTQAQLDNQEVLIGKQSRRRHSIIFIDFGTSLAINIFDAIVDIFS